jgi:predicted adenylyl cyclase CyaB
MTDTFLPAKNEGDMVRIRRESEGAHRRLLLTLKKWVVTSDGGKEREETEGKISAPLAIILMWLGRSLRGSSLLSFSKRRQLFAGTLSGRQAVISVDTVSGLGSYSGTYLEIEVLVPIGEDVNAARESIYAMSARLLSNPEQVKQSYMDMLKLATAAV